MLRVTVTIAALKINGHFIMHRCKFLATATNWTDNRLDAIEHLEIIKVIHGQMSLLSLNFLTLPLQVFFA